MTLAINIMESCILATIQITSAIKVSRYTYIIVKYLKRLGSNFTIRISVYITVKQF